MEWEEHADVTRSLLARSTSPPLFKKGLIVRRWMSADFRSPSLGRFPSFNKGRTFPRFGLTVPPKRATDGCIAVLCLQSTLGWSEPGGPREAGSQPEFFRACPGASLTGVARS
jgi:hypothetical protein